MEMIKVGIVGYGKLGKAVEKAISHQNDMELFGIFSRRDPESLKTDSAAYSLDTIEDFKDEIDVLILCSGSAKDIPVQGPALAKSFSTVDAYDNHDLIFDYYKKMDEIAKENKNTAIIGTGWDPGLFSLNRILSQAVLPQGDTYTFWGPGLSQGHSDALRRVDGVKYASQYTLPSEEMIEDIKSGKKVSYKGKTAHKRDCYVVAEEGADKERIKEEILTMPDYFAGYETRVNFVSEEEYLEKYTGLSHGGKVIRQGQTSEGTHATYEFSLKLESNPEFTGSVCTAYARAAYRMSQEENYGAKTVADIPVAMLSPKTKEEMLKGLI